MKTEKLEEIKFGQTVVFSKKLIRKREYRFTDKEEVFRREYRFWKETPAHYSAENKGIVIGVRTIQEGFIYREDGLTYISPDNYKKALLVAINLKLNPILVPFDSITLSVNHP